MIDMNVSLLCQCTSHTRLIQLVRPRLSQSLLLPLVRERCLSFLSCRIPYHDQRFETQMPADHREMAEAALQRHVTRRKRATYPMQSVELNWHPGIQA